MCVLEKCGRPFETPSKLGIRPKIICRFSELGDEILNYSVSRPNSFDKKQQDEKACVEDTRREVPEKKIRRKPLQKSSDLDTSQILSSTRSLPKEYHEDRSLHVKNIPSRSKPKNTALYEGSSSNGSDTSLSSRSRSGSGSSSQTWNSKDSTLLKGRASSVGGCSNRSPLSVMRYVAFPVFPYLRPCKH
jgi:hypothetical protein